MIGKVPMQLCSVMYYRVANLSRLNAVNKSLVRAACSVDRPIVRHPKEVRSGAPHVSISLNDCACQATLRQHYRTSLAFPTFPLFAP